MHACTPHGCTAAALYWTSPPPPCLLSPAVASQPQLPLTSQMAWLRTWVASARESRARGALGDALGTLSGMLGGGEEAALALALSRPALPLPPVPVRGGGMGTGIGSAREAGSGCSSRGAGEGSTATSV